MPITTISTTTDAPAFEVAVFIRDAVAQKYGNAEICSIQDDDSQVQRMGTRLQVGVTQMRYLNDPVFHTLTELLINAMRLQKMTADDVKEASGLAISIYEFNTLYTKKEKNVEKKTPAPASDSDACKDNPRHRRSPEHRRRHGRAR